MNFKIEIKKDRRILVHIDSLQIQDQGLNFLFGESGIGKTMIAHAIYGLLDPAEFNITINDQAYPEYLQTPEFQKLATYGFYVFQEPSSHLNPLLKVREQITEGSLRQSQAEQEILNNLWPDKNSEQLNPILDIYPRPYRPSGGEKQRILMTMAFKKIDLYLHQDNPPQTLFIFDEPTGSLDDVNRNIFLNYLIEKYLRCPFTIVFITHDYSIIARLTQRSPDLLERISFTDIHLTADGLQQENFSARRYLEWNLGIQPSTSTPEAGSAPVLKVENPLGIFNRELVITRDAEGTEQVPLEVHGGEIVYLKAGSGVGKTTLAKCVMGLLQTQHLQLCLAGLTLTEKTSLAAWRHKIWGKKATMVFQHADESLNLNGKVKNVFAGLPLSEKMDESQLIRQLQWIFSSPIGAEFLQRKVMSLSGGQKQRLNLLRSLVLDTDLIILDEPLNGLGFDSIQKVIETLREKQRSSKGILLISHNEDIFDKLIPAGDRYYLNSVS